MMPSVTKIVRAKSTLLSSRLGAWLRLVVFAGISVQVCNAASPVSYNRDVRPILSENCFHCHGPDAKNRKAKLRLDLRDAAVKSEAFVPGNPDESEIIRRILTEDIDDKMPPVETHKIITPAQVEILKRWIAEGAVYEPHWSYAPIQRAATPLVKNSSWAQTPVDAFVLARLEEQNLSPSPAANRATLLRRLALDLTGLPPTFGEVSRFEKDKSRNAVAKAVERLLASPHYGERMATPWLDAVRFADTVGYHGDQNQNIFPYRDYVIASFNQNKPFDQFTLEQIAGDLLPNPTVEQKIATGFNRLNMMTREGGAQPKEYLAKYSADRVRTVSTAWLGSTLACAECHDHKYDPFTAKDFYSLAAFFDDVKQWGVYNDYTYTPNPELKAWSNQHPFPPELFVTNSYLVKREGKLKEELEGYIRDRSKKLSTTATEAFVAWKKEIADFLKLNPDGWSMARQPLVTMANTNSRTTLAVQTDGAVLCTGKALKNDSYRVELRGQTGWIAAVRLELIPHPSHKNSAFRPSDDSSDVKISATVRRADGQNKPLKFHRSFATAFQSQYENGHELLDVHPNWKISVADKTNHQSAVFLLDPPVNLAEGDSLMIKLASGDLGSFRVATTPIANLSPLESGATDAFKKSITRHLKSKSGDASLVSAWFLSTTNSPEAFGRLKDIHQNILECRKGIVPTLVTVATTNRLVTRVLPRGNWQDESGEPLQPAVPHFLPQPPNSTNGPLTRLDLAHWLTSRENPLTARAFVNRLWKQFFGNGLANQPEELGAQGEWPSHPELLDWLADEFIASGWDVKHMVRLIVNSSTYQQDSKMRPALNEIDPRNRLLAHQNPRRLDAEFIRDNALAIAGLLDISDVGGPSVFPYQPAGYYANIQFPDRDYFASPDERQYRRGLYSHWQRTFLHPMLANFDAPAREECAVDRPVSSTPQQALTLLNDPTFTEAARVFAERILRDKKAKNDIARLQSAFQIALLRPAKPAEITSLKTFLETQRANYAANNSDAEKLLKLGNRPFDANLPRTELAAWTSVARVILNLHETITSY